MGMCLYGPIRACTGLYEPIRAYTRGKNQVEKEKIHKKKPLGAEMNYFEEGFFFLTKKKAFRPIVVYPLQDCVDLLCCIDKSLPTGLKNLYFSQHIIQ